MIIKTFILNWTTIISAHDFVEAFFKEISLMAFANYIILYCGKPH